MVNMVLVTKVFVQNGADVYVVSGSVKGFTVKRPVEVCIFVLSS